MIMDSITNQQLTMKQKLLLLCGVLFISIASCAQEVVRIGIIGLDTSHSVAD